MFKLKQAQTQLMVDTEQARLLHLHRDDHIQDPYITEIQFPVAKLDM